MGGFGTDDLKRNHFEGNTGQANWEAHFTSVDFYWLVLPFIPVARLCT